MMSEREATIKESTRYEPVEHVENLTPQVDISTDTFQPAKSCASADDATAEKPCVSSELVKRMTCLAVAPRDPAFLDDVYDATFELTASIANGQQQNSSEVRRAFRELLAANSEALHSSRVTTESRSTPRRASGSTTVNAVVAP